MQSQHNFPVKIAKIHAVFAIEIGTRQLPSSLQDFEAEYPSCETLDAFSRLATSVNYWGVSSANHAQTSTEAGGGRQSKSRRSPALTGAGFFSERQVPTVRDSTFYRYNQGRVSIKPF